MSNKASTSTVIPGLSSKYATFVWSCAKGKLTTAANKLHGSGHKDAAANGVIVALALIFLILLVG